MLNKIHLLSTAIPSTHVAFYSSLSQLTQLRILSNCFILLLTSAFLSCIYYRMVTIYSGHRHGHFRVPRLSVPIAGLMLRISLVTCSFRVFGPTSISSWLMLHLWPSHGAGVWGCSSIMCKCRSSEQRLVYESFEAAFDPWCSLLPFPHQLPHSWVRLLSASTTALIALTSLPAHPYICTDY